MAQQRSRPTVVTPTVLRPGPVPRHAAVVLALTGVLLSATLVIAVVRGLVLADVWYDGFYVTVAVGGGALGLMIVRRLNDNAVGWLLLAIAAASAMALVALTLRGTSVEWVGEWWPLVPIAMLPLPVLVFPDGPLDTPLWRTVWRVALAAVLLPTIAIAVGTWLEPQPVYDWKADVPGRDVAQPWITAGVVGLLVLMAIVVVGALAVLLVRRKSATELERAQLRLLAYGLAVVPPAVLLEPRLPGALMVAALSVPVAMTIAIVAHGLYDIDLFINRSIVYAVLTTVVFGAYSVSVTILREILEQAGAASFAATGVVAATFVPIRDHVQQAVNRMLYGHRDEPYAVITRQGQQLQAMLDVDSVLPGLADTVMTALRVPYVEIRVSRAGQLEPAVQTGRLVGRTVRYPMRHDGVVVGELVVAPRQPGVELTDTEDSLLADLATRAAPAVSTVVEVQDARRSSNRSS